MSTSDPNPNPSVVSVSRSTVVTPQTPVTEPTNAAQTPLSSPYKSIAPLHRLPRQNHYAHHSSASPSSSPVWRSNPISGSPHHPRQELSGLLYPFASSGRPGRRSSGPVGSSPGGYSPQPGYAYHHGQFGSDPIVQFMRATNPQIQQSLGSGHMKGVPYFLQPRVALPHTSILDNNGRRKNARSRNETLVVVRNRKVRITEGASLYSLCRSWFRNGTREEVQPQRSDTITYLPKPLPVDMTETELIEEPICEEQKEDEESVEHLTSSDLLKRHVVRAKKVRARLKEARLKRIARYKERLTLLLQPQQCRNE